MKNDAWKTVENVTRAKYVLLANGPTMCSRYRISLNVDVYSLWRKSCGIFSETLQRNRVSQYVFRLSFISLNIFSLYDTHYR